MSGSVDEPGRPSVATVTGAGGRRETTYAHWLLGEASTVCLWGVSVGIAWSSFENSSPDAP